MVKEKRLTWSHESAPVNLKKYSTPCVACELAKSKRSSHTNRIRVPLEPGSLIYVDVWGPCEVMSLINENVHNRIHRCSDEASVTVPSQEEVGHLGVRQRLLCDGDREAESESWSQRLHHSE